MTAPQSTIGSLSLGVALFSIAMLLVGLIALFRTRRGLPWYCMLFGLICLAVSTGLICVLLFDNNLASGSNWDGLVYIIVLGVSIPLGFVFFFAGLCAWAFRAARMMERIRELEYLDANLSAELVRLDHIKDHKPA